VFDVPNDAVGQESFLMFQKDVSVEYYQISSGRQPKIITRAGGTVKKITSVTILGTGTKHVIQANFKHNDWDAKFDNGASENSPDSLAVTPASVIDAEFLFERLCRQKWTGGSAVPHYCVICIPKPIDRLFCIADNKETAAL